MFRAGSESLAGWLLPKSICKHSLTWLNSWAWFWSMVQIILEHGVSQPQSYLVVSGFQIGCEESLEQAAGSLSSSVQKEMFPLTKSALAVIRKLWMSFSKTDSCSHVSKVVGRGKLEIVCSLVTSKRGVHRSYFEKPLTKCYHLH